VIDFVHTNREQIGNSRKVSTPSEEYFRIDDLSSSSTEGLPEGYKLPNCLALRGIIWRTKLID
jgi:hypothetical protein